MTGGWWLRFIKIGAFLYKTVENHNRRKSIPDLLCNQRGRRPPHIRPFAQEILPEKRVERFFLPSTLVILVCKMLLQSAHIPLQHHQRTLGRIWLVGGGNEEMWMLAPILREFDVRGRRENEWRGCHGEQVAFEGRDALLIERIIHLSSFAPQRKGEGPKQVMEEYNWYPSFACLHSLKHVFLL